jgi:hypothetical protein
MNHYFECTWAGVVYCTPVFGLVGGAPALVSMDKVEKSLFRSHEPVPSCISLNANDYGAGPENAVFHILQCGRQYMVICIIFI